MQPEILPFSPEQSLFLRPKGPHRYGKSTPAFSGGQFCLNIRLESMHDLHKMLQIVRLTTALTVPELLLKTKPPLQWPITTLEYHSSLRGSCWTAHLPLCPLYIPPRNHSCSEHRLILLLQRPETYRLQLLWELIKRSVTWMRHPSFDTLGERLVHGYITLDEFQEQIANYITYAVGCIWQWTALFRACSRNSSFLLSPVVRLPSYRCLPPLLYE